MVLGGDLVLSLRKSCASSSTGSEGGFLGSDKVGGGCSSVSVSSSSVEMARPLESRMGRFSSAW